LLFLFLLSFFHPFCPDQKHSPLFLDILINYLLWENLCPKWADLVSSSFENIKRVLWDYFLFLFLKNRAKKSEVLGHKKHLQWKWGLEIFTSFQNLSFAKNKFPIVWSMIKRIQEEIESFVRPGQRISSNRFCSIQNGQLQWIFLLSFSNKRNLLSVNCAKRFLSSSMLLQYFLSDVRGVENLLL